VDIAGQSKNSLPGFFVSRIYRCVFRRKGQAGLENLEEGHSQETHYTNGDTHLSDSKSALPEFIKR
jgi:hypothetical protein